MSSRKGRECGPGLSAWWNVLPLFFANYALPRRDTARRVLGAAGSANERVHITVPRTGLIVDYRPSRPVSLASTSRRLWSLETIKAAAHRIVDSSFRCRRSPVDLARVGFGKRRRNSERLFAGSERFTSNTSGTRAMLATGAMSRMKSKLRLSYSVALIGFAVLTLGSV